MAYKQTTSVNLTPSTLRQGTKIITNYVNWCLLHVQTAFSAPWAGSNANNAISGLKYLHKDRNFPAGVAVPVWFKSKYNGHVLAHKDGKFYSTPLSPGKVMIYNSVDDVINAYKKIGTVETYVGWSEDIGGKRVVEWVADKPAPKPQPAPVINSPVYGRKYINNHAYIGRVAQFMRKNYPAYTSSKALGNKWGNYIEASIKEFQRRNGMQADGNIGPKTQAKLKQAGFKG